MYYKKYLIKENDHFDPLNFPQLTADIDLIRGAIADASGTDQSENLISYLKLSDNKSERPASNPEFEKQLTGLMLPLNDLKDMFDSCGHSPDFQRELEQYITSQFNEPIPV